MTFAAVNILWLLFSAESVEQWWSMLIKIFSFGSLHITRDYLNLFSIHGLQAVLEMLGIRVGHLYGITMVSFLLAALLLCLIPDNNYNKRRDKLTVFTSVMAACAFVLGVLSLGTESVFVYYGF